MKDEPRQVIRVLKAFKTENATYELDEVYAVRASLAKQFVSQGLVEIVNVDEDEDEDGDAEVETLMGAGPDSGTYWHGELDQVTRGIESGEPPRNARDLFRLMGLSEIRIRKPAPRAQPPLAELNFDAAFQEEHGVGVLTDAWEIRGLGFSSDVTPFGE